MKEFIILYDMMIGKKPITYKDYKQKHEQIRSVLNISLSTYYRRLREHNLKPNIIKKKKGNKKQYYKEYYERKKK